MSAGYTGLGFVRDAQSTFCPRHALVHLPLLLFYMTEQYFSLEFFETPLASFRK